MAFDSASAALPPRGNPRPFARPKMAGITMRVRSVDEVIPLIHRHCDALHDLRSVAGAPHVTSHKVSVAWIDPHSYGAPPFALIATARQGN